MRRFFCGMCAAGVISFLAAPGTASAGYTVTDVIPANQSSESFQNSEPNIAVNPSNPLQAVISSFGTTSGSSSGTLFTTGDGGATFTALQTITTFDSTVDWSSSGNAYLANINQAAGFDVSRSNNPSGGTAFTSVSGAAFVSNPDQPWVKATQVAGADRVYVAFNNNGVATVRQSTDSGATWSNSVVETTNPGSQDLPSARIGLNGSRVYVAYYRAQSAVGNGDFIGNLAVVRDDNGATGAARFQNLNGSSGVTVAASNFQIPFDGTSLGTERLGSDVSIAVDPHNADKLYVAYASVTGGVSHLTIARSTNAGASWTSIYQTTAAAGLPALSITSNGTLGFLYSALAGGKLETHFARTSNDFASLTDDVLSRFTDGVPASQGQPYIGDYQDLEAVGNQFVGTFSASNDDSNPGTNFPQGVTFLRNMTTGGSGLVPSGASVSIDPFFFSVTVPEPMGIALIPAAAWLLRRRSRQPN